MRSSAEDVRDATYMNGKPGVALGLSKQSKGNSVAIVDEFNRRMDEARKHTPEGIQIAKREGFLDNTQVIRESFEETISALWFGGLLAVLVVFVFIRRFRPTMIVAADADMAPPSHYVEFFELLDGGLRDGGWMGEGRPKGGHALAILPGLTHYNLGISPLFAAVTLSFLDQPEG